MSGSKLLSFLPPLLMSLPQNLDTNSHDVGFGGNTDLQAEAGTYPECRHMLERSLQRAVTNGTLDAKDAEKRLKRADVVWERKKKDPEVKARLKLRQELRQAHEDAILQATANTISELRGETVEVVVKDEKKPKA